MVTISIAVGYTVAGSFATGDVGDRFGIRCACVSCWHCCVWSIKTLLEHFWMWVDHVLKELWLAFEDLEAKLALEGYVGACFAGLGSLLGRLFWAGLDWLVHRCFLLFTCYFLAFKNTKRVNLILEKLYSAGNLFSLSIWVIFLGKGILSVNPPRFFLYLLLLLIPSLLSFISNYFDSF